MSVYLYMLHMGIYDVDMYVFSIYFTQNALMCNQFENITLSILFPQQRKLMGSSAQISSFVRRRGSKERVPEEGSGSFRKVPESSGVCSGRFRRMLV